MVLVGMHPVLTQVPPKNLRSAMATRIPEREARGQERAGLPGSDDDGVEAEAHAPASG